MTVLANVRGRDMRRAFAGGIDAVVAARTIARNVHVVEIGGQPGGGRMAIVTIIATRNMGRVLAGCDNTIVARAASAQNLCVIDGDNRLKRNRIVTVFANIGGLHVNGTLAGGSRAVVTCHTIINDPQVVEHSRQPGRCVVTIVALVTGRYVRQRFPGSLNTVMTTNAAAGQRGVVHKRDGIPARGNMAVRALAIGKDVARRFG